MLRPSCRSGSSLVACSFWGRKNVFTQPGSNSDVPWSKALKPYLKINVQAELSLYQGFVFLVARSPEINYLLICLARSPVEKRQRIWADRIPQLPTVAFDDLTNLISDNVRRCRLRQ